MVIQQHPPNVQLAPMQYIETPIQYISHTLIACQAQSKQVLMEKQAHTLLAILSHFPPFIVPTVPTVPVVLTAPTIPTVPTEPIQYL